MRKSVVVGVLWIATLILAWSLGSNIDPRAQRSTAQPREDREPEPGPMPTEPPVADRAAKEEKTELAEPSGAGVVKKAEPFSLDGVTSFDKASKLFMKFAQGKLDEGPEGHLELFRVLDQIAQNEELHKTLFRNEEEMIRHLYPWVKFLVTNDQKVVDFMETLYRTAAEEPEWYEGIDNDTLEPITEGLAVLLPSAVSEETLDRFRDHVTKILERPRESLPEALQRNSGEFKRNLKYWAPPLSSAQILERLLAPDVSSVEKLELLERVDPADLAAIDAVGLIVEAIRSGAPQAVWTVRALPVSGADVARLDSAILEGAATGAVHGWSINHYLQTTKRETWAAARPLIESGLRGGGKATNAFAQSLVYFRDRPPTEYVQQVLDSYDLDSNTVNMLKNSYKLK